MKKLSNKQIANILYEIGEILAMKNISFKPQAYKNAADAIARSSKNIYSIYKKDSRASLDELEGVGASISKKLEELIKTGHLKYYENLKKQYPIKITELERVEGIGPKTIASLYKKLKIKNLSDLKKAARQGKIRKLKGFGAQSEQKILKELGLAQTKAKRKSLKAMLPLANKIVARLQKTLGARKVVIAGSIRRKKETIGDIDLLATSTKPQTMIDAFTSMPEVKQILSKGKTRSSIRLKNGMDADLRVVRPEVFGAALQYFTGDKQHNIHLRKIAKNKGYKLNEYGLFKEKKLIACKTEEEIYNQLGMKTMPPEKRLDKGEIEQAQINK